MYQASKPVANLLQTLGNNVIRPSLFGGAIDLNQHLWILGFLLLVLILIFVFRKINKKDFVI